MEPELPSIERVENAAAMLAVFEEFNLYDAEIRAVRMTTARDESPVLEVDLYLPSEYATWPAPGSREYRITLRCGDIVDLVIGDFVQQNVVGDYSFAPVEATDGRGTHVVLSGTVGCDLDLRCRTVHVAAVTPILSPSAV